MLDAQTTAKDAIINTGFRGIPLYAFDNATIMNTPTLIAEIITAHILILRSFSPVKLKT